MLLPSHSGRAGAHALAAPTSSGSHACPQVAARPHHHYHQASQQQGGPQVLLPPLPLQQQLQQQGRRSHHHRRRRFACEASAGACVAGGACAASAACLKWPSAPWCSKDAHSLRVHASVRAFACVHANHPAPVPPPHQPTERQQQQQPSTSTAIPPADYPRIPGVIAEEPAVSPRAEAQLTLEQYREIYDRLIGVFQVRVLWCRGWGVGAGRAASPAQHELAGWGQDRLKGVPASSSPMQTTVGSRAYWLLPPHARSLPTAGAAARRLEEAAGVQQAVVAAPDGRV